MICAWCRDAGWAVREGDRFVAAEAWHAKCKGGNWCDCQHKTDSALARKGDGSGARREAD